MLVGIGLLSLAAGLLVYLTDRDTSRAAWMPAVAALAGSHWFGALGLWLPGFVHPFAFSLFTAAALPSRSAWRYGGCAIWCAVNLAFEIGQHPHLKAPLAEALQQGPGPAPLTRALANYFLGGTFDGGDVIAAVLGALAAAAVLRLMQAATENDDAS